MKVLAAAAYVICKPNGSPEVDRDYASHVGMAAKKEDTEELLVWLGKWKRAGENDDFINHIKKVIVQAAEFLALI